MMIFIMVALKTLWVWPVLLGRSIQVSLKFANGRDFIGILLIGIMNMPVVLQATVWMWPLSPLSPLSPPSPPSPPSRHFRALMISWTALIVGLYQ